MQNAGCASFIYTVLYRASKLWRFRATYFKLWPSWTENSQHIIPAFISFNLTSSFCTSSLHIQVMVGNHQALVAYLKQSILALGLAKHARVTGAVAQIQPGGIFPRISPKFTQIFWTKKKRLKKQHQRQQLLVFPAVASCGPTQRRIPRFQPNHFRSFEIAGALSASPEGRTQRLVGNFIDSSLFKKSRSKVVLLNKKKKI